MAIRQGRNWTEILGTVAVSAVTIGAGAYFVDWLKARGYWPKPKELDAAGDEFGCDDGGCVGNEVEEAESI